ncbi:MAG: radical SAM family heme chaperone HemW [Candidatus Kapaibacteriales bacterium]
MIGVYIHIPFCEKKCRYCDFYSLSNSFRIEEFVNALCKEIQLSVQYFNSRIEVETIFFGGGTPSILNIYHLEKIINCINKFFGTSELKEFTLECNPGTDFTNKLPEYKSLGINRLSIGVQSFVDSELIFLGRIHNSNEAFKSIQKALDYNFENVNADIIFSIPNQTTETLHFTLEKLLELQIPHISAYSLIYEEGTPLYNELKKGKVQKVGEEIDFKFFDLIHTTLSDAGYEHYEVSNFAKNEMFCQHNLRYWNRLEYIGFGPSAHSFINEQRFSNVKNLNKYFDALNQGQLPIEYRETLTFKQKVMEKIMLGLRSVGLDFNSFRDLFNIDLKLSADDIFEHWVENGLAVEDVNHIRLTHKGYFLCDSLTLNLLNRLKI